MTDTADIKKQVPYVVEQLSDESLAPDDAVLQAQGHRPELARSFSWVGAIGLSFSIANSWLGYGATFGTPLAYGGGPTVLFGVMIAAVAQWIVLLGLAELCSALPSSGRRYDYLTKTTFTLSITGLILVLIAVLASGRGHYHPEVLTTFQGTSGWDTAPAWLLSITMGQYCYAAIGAVTHIAEEMPQPGRRIPLVINLGVLVGVMTAVPWVTVMLCGIQDIDAVHKAFIPSMEVYYQATGSFGNGLADSAWNAWIGNMANANELLGLLHGLYGVGAVLSPLVATSLITEAKVPWYYFYYIMIGCAAIELAFCLFVFWDSTAAALREATTQEDGPGGGLREALFTKRSAWVTWICAFFLLGYVGIEVALGGWIVTFMMRVRHGADFASGMVATGFWLGIACGRVVLGFITPRIGEKMAIIVYSLFAIACGLILWLVPNFYASAVAVSFQGFFLGPFFPAAVIVATKLLPRSLHVSAIGFAAAFGGGGAAVLPFVVGAIAQARGVQVLQPFIIGLSAGILLLWLGLPRLPKKVDEEQHRTSDV
ncbi:hypothetical protein APSETT445_009578 [Aspergillus pseudonomiae]